MTKTIDVTGLPKHAISAVETLVDLLKQQHVRKPIEHKQFSDSELEQLFDEASGDAPVLPADFSRADIYSDHD
jgi:hypothetical protein